MGTEPSTEHLETAFHPQEYAVIPWCDAREDVAILYLSADTVTNMPS